MTFFSWRAFLRWASSRGSVSLKRTCWSAFWPSVFGWKNASTLAPFMAASGMSFIFLGSVGLWTSSSSSSSILIIIYSTTYLVNVLLVMLKGGFTGKTFSTVNTQRFGLSFPQRSSCRWRAISYWKALLQVEQQNEFSTGWAFFIWRWHKSFLEKVLLQWWQLTRCSGIPQRLVWR